MRSASSSLGWLYARNVDAKKRPIDQRERKPPVAMAASTCIRIGASMCSLETTSSGSPDRKCCARVSASS